MSSKQRTRKTYVGRVYLGHGRYQWVGRFPTKKARDEAIAEARVELRKNLPEEITVGRWAETFLARYRREHKLSSYGTVERGLRAFLADFSERPLRSITRAEALNWADRQPASRLPSVRTMFSAAVDAELIERNPFRKLVRPSRGRADDAPPTPEELSRLLAACSVHDWYAPTMRALIQFAAYTGMRPGEIFALEWSDVDFDANRVHVARRAYNGRIDVPKSGKTRIVALTPPARDAIVGLPRDTALVFTTKQGQRLSQTVFGRYWRAMCARAELHFDFYLASKHYAVWYLYATLGLTPRVIAAQMGWSTKTTLDLIDRYGHGDVGALDEIDRAFSSNVLPLRAVSDASQTQVSS